MGATCKEVWSGGGNMVENVERRLINVDQNDSYS